MIFVVLVIFWKEDRVTHFAANRRYNLDVKHAKREGKDEYIDVIN